MSFALAGGLLPTVQSQARIASRERRSAGNFSPFWKKDQFLGKTWKLKYGNASYDNDSASTTTAASGKVLVPNAQSDCSSLSMNILGNQEVASDTQVSEEEEKVQDDGNTDGLMTSMSSEPISEMEVHEITQQSVDNLVDKSSETFEEKKRRIPPPGSGQRIYEIDPYLQRHRAHLDYRLPPNFISTACISVVCIFISLSTQICVEDSKEELIGKSTILPMVDADFDNPSFTCSRVQASISCSLETRQWQRICPDLTASSISETLAQHALLSEHLFNMGTWNESSNLSV